jgi:hypothetical protein
LKVGPGETENDPGSRASEEKMEGTNQSAVMLIDVAVAGFLKALADKEVKLAVPDVLRLLELRKQMAYDELREVRVRWVESNPAPLLT